MKRQRFELSWVPSQIYLRRQECGCQIPQLKLQKVHICIAKLLTVICFCRLRTVPKCCRAKEEKLTAQRRLQCNSGVDFEFTVLSVCVQFKETYERIQTLNASTRSERVGGTCSSRGAINRFIFVSILEQQYSWWRFYLAFSDTLGFYSACLPFRFF